MRLLIITQRINQTDTNLANHIRWVEVLSTMVDEVTVIAQSVGEHHLPSNVQVYSLGKELGFSRPRQVMRLFGHLTRIVPRMDALFVLMIPAYVILAAPFAWIFHKKIYLWFVHKRVSWMLKLAERLVTKIFTASPESFRLPSKKVVVTGHAIDTDFFSPDPTVARLPGKILTVGRIAPSKNLHLMIEAVGLLRDQGIMVQLEIVGAPVLKEDIAYERVLRDRLLELGLRNQVIFRGGKTPSEVRRIFQEAALFVNASATGSIDRAVLEAMACGCPVVVANEAFQHWLPVDAYVPSLNVEALASAMDFQLQHPRAGDELRAKVVKDHELHQTMRTIVETIRVNLRLSR